MKARLEGRVRKLPQMMLVLALAAAIALAAILGSIAPSNAGPQYFAALNDTIPAAE